MYISKYEFNRRYNRGIKKIFYFYFKYKINKNNKKYIDNEIKKYGKLFKLDKYQANVVFSDEKYSLVVAGAGSGKSYTIINKINYLRMKGVKSEEILVLSFTNEACNNLKKKLNMNVMTFHKLGRDILYKNGFNVNLVSSSVLNDIVRKQIKDFQFIKKLPNNHFKVVENVVSFINLFKGNGFKYDKFDEFLNLCKYDFGFLGDYNKEFIKFVKAVYFDYQYYLDKNKCIDFHDMIVKSIDVVKEGGIYPYKYIIIDEYQDVSLIKCELIKAIISYTDCKLLAVGDDFQSIYRFTGSNLDVFTNFSYYFKYSKIFKLENNYRNSVELISVMNKFILKNSFQIYKNAICFKHVLNPIYICYYDDDYVSLVNELILYLEDVVVLGRNNSDLIGINGISMTVHKSKGLEFKNVIVVNLSDCINGFPCKIGYDDVFKYVINVKNDYPFDEERRLFYVALTRTIDRCFLFVSRKNPSIFINEIINSKNVYIFDDFSNLIDRYVV